MECDYCYTPAVGIAVWLDDYPARALCSRHLEGVRSAFIRAEIILLDAPGAEEVLAEYMEERLRGRDTEV